MKQVEIFWTGGFDSTFRMVQLSQMDVSIRPIYLRDFTNRKSEKNELEAIAAIYDCLRVHPKTKATFLPIQLVGGEEFRFSNNVPNEHIEMPSNETAKKTWESMRSKIDKNLSIVREGKIFRGTYGLNRPMSFSYQYIGISAYANAHNANVELGFTKSDAAIRKTLECFGKIIKEDDGRYCLLKDATDPDLYEMFKNIRFPIIDLEKTEIKELYEKWGYQDIADLTWFCFKPIDGEPCGQCVTCVPAIREGMAHRFSATALQRYAKFEEREKSVEYLEKVEKMYDTLLSSEIRKQFL